MLAETCWSKLYLVYSVQNIEINLTYIHVSYCKSQENLNGMALRVFHSSIFATRAHLINLLTPSVNYSGRTAPLTSKVAFYLFIQQI